MYSEYGEIRRGDIFYIAIPYATGHEMEKDRLGIVVGNDHLNNNCPVVTVVPCSASDRREAPEHITVRSTPVPSTALCEHIYTVDRSRIGKKVGHMKKKIGLMREKFGACDGHRCKECSNFVTGKYNDMTLRKCQVYGLTHSEASDWAGKWPACGMFGKEYIGRPIIELRRGIKKPPPEPLEGQIMLPT